MGIGGSSIRGRKQTLSKGELSGRVKQLCGAEPCGTGVWVKLTPEDFGPFFQSEDVCLWESPAVSAATAPAWVRRAVDELLAGTGGTVTNFLLHIVSSGQALSLESLSEIVAEAQCIIDMGAASFVVGYRAADHLKAGEVTVLVLASRGGFVCAAN